MTGRQPDRWIRWTTTGCVALLALIAGTVSYLHMHTLVEVARSARVGRGPDATVGGRDDRGRVHHPAGRLALWWSGRGVAVGAAGGGEMASLAANVAVAEPTLTGRVIAAWPSFALIACL